MILFDIGYLLIIIVTFPLWLPYLVRKRYRALLWRRLWTSRPDKHTASIWIHAVSVGEVNSMVSLLDDLHHHYPKHQIVLSASTPAGYERAQISAAQYRVVPAPFDFSFSIHRFIACHRPELIVLNELEIWPNWLSIAKKKMIPLILINARLSDRAFRRYQKFKNLSSWMINQLDMILCQSEHYQKRFQFLGIKKTKLKIGGHIKADEAMDQLSGLADNPTLKKNLALPSQGKPLLVLASTHEEDEAIIFPALPQILKDYQVIIAPRHLSRLDALEKNLQNLTLHPQRWSTHLGQPLTELVIFDQMGKLLPLIFIADLVIMGGTFLAKTGGHNLFEPLACNKLILGGPHIENFPDIAQDLKNSGLYLCFQSTPELLVLLNSAKFTSAQIIAKSQPILSKYGGAKNKILEEISQWLPS